MFEKFVNAQYASYKEAYEYFKGHPQCLINIEEFISREIRHFIDLNLPDIVRDYNEASYLHPFWKNYPPDERGRSPVGDQFPWIEVGEQVFGNKLSRYFFANFRVKDSGLPSGADDRCIISSERIRQILHITDSVWVFIDIKSAGPRDSFENAVMSPYQISGSGDWTNINDGMRNKPIKANGLRRSHDFLCAISPIYVLSDNTVAPLVTCVIKPEYDMVKVRGKNVGQPLKKIQVISIPNGILLTQNPNYNSIHQHLFHPGKDDEKKDPRKKRARVSFSVLKSIANWRVWDVNVQEVSEL